MRPRLPQRPIPWQPPPRSPGSSRFPARAFTLIELVVVLALLAILSALILPEMRGTFGDALLRAASRDLVDACGIASSRAVSFNETLRLRLDPETGRYQLERSPRHSPSAVAFQPVRDLPGSTGIIDPRIKARVRSADPLPLAQVPTSDETHQPADATPVPAGIAFYPDGTADRAEIVLRDREGYGLALRLNPVTARVRVIRLEPRP